MPIQYSKDLIDTFELLNDTLYMIDNFRSFIMKRLILQDFTMDDVESIYTPTSLEQQLLQSIISSRQNQTLHLLTIQAPRLSLLT